MGNQDCYRQASMAIQMNKCRMSFTTLRHLRYFRIIRYHNIYIYIYMYFWKNNMKKKSRAVSRSGRCRSSSVTISSTVQQVGSSDFRSSTSHRHAETGEGRFRASGEGEGTKAGVWANTFCQATGGLGAGPWGIWKLVPTRFLSF